jgi:hypothetical protein
MKREETDLNELTVAVANCGPRIRARVYAALAGLIAGKADKIAKSESGRWDLNVVPSTHPDITQAQQHIESTVSHFFKRTAAKLAAAVQTHEKLVKMGLSPQALIAALPPIQWDELVPDIFGDLHTIARTSAGRAIASLDVTNEKMLSDVNDVAAKWAQDRAAELVGMKRLANGKLVQNPESTWNITERTRNDLRQIIAAAFEKKTSMSELADAIQNADTFSDQRAHLIAVTETSRAANRGNLQGWKATSQVKAVDVVCSADHKDDENCDCSDMADNGPYPIDEAPDLPIHPGCQCSLIVAELT